MHAHVSVTWTSATLQVTKAGRLEQWSKLSSAINRYDLPENVHEREVIEASLETPRMVVGSVCCTVSTIRKAPSVRYGPVGLKRTPCCVLQVLLLSYTVGGGGTTTSQSLNICSSLLQHVMT